MHILIAADMEGITGVTTWDHVDPGTPEYDRYRRLMTQDVNAAIRGAYDGGADQVSVTDGHAGGRNILLEELDPRARLNSGNSSPFGMVQAIDNHVQGVIFIGYHARAGTLNAILDHTWSSRCVANVWVNNLLLGEIGLNAAVCGHFNTPVIMISGDQSACGEAREMLGALETVIVKYATGRKSAECLPVEVAQKHIYESASKAVKNLSAGHAPAPFLLPPPVQVSVEFFNSDMADQAVRLPGGRRLDGRRINYESQDMPTAYQSFRAAVALAGL